MKLDFLRGFAIIMVATTFFLQLSFTLFLLIACPLPIFSIISVMSLEILAHQLLTKMIMRYWYEFLLWQCFLPKNDSVSMMFANMKGDK